MRESAHRLTLATCTENHDLAGRVFFNFVRLDEGILRYLDVAELDTVNNGFFHGASKNSDLASGLNRCISRLLETEDVGGKGSKDDTSMDAFNQLHNGLTHHFSELVKVGTSAFVESERRQRTPSSPRRPCDAGLLARQLE